MPSTNPNILFDEDAIRAEVQETVNQRNVFRNAFRETDVSDVNTGTVYFTVYDDAPEEFEIVPKGAEFPRRGSIRRRVPCVRNKYGEEYGLTKEDDMDSVYDELGDEANSKMRRLANRLDKAAYMTLSENLSEEGVFTPDGGQDGVLTYEDIVDTNAEMENSDGEPNNSFEADTIFVGAYGKRDLLKDEHFTHATEAGDDTVREGYIGAITGIGDVYVSTSSDLGAGEAILVDSDQYGREGVWQGMDTNAYSEDKTQTFNVMQMDFLGGWAAMERNAAMKIES